MDNQRMLELLIKATNDTKATFAELEASLKALRDKTVEVRVETERATEQHNVFIKTLGGIVGAITGVVGGAISWLVDTFKMIAETFTKTVGPALLVGLAITAIAVAIGGLIGFGPVLFGWIAGLTAALSVLSVATAGILGMAAAVWTLGMAYLGTNDPAAEMLKTHAALANAIKAHQVALAELKQAQGGVDLYGLGPGSKATTVAMAQKYVTATGAELTGAQQDYAATARGVGGPVSNLREAIEGVTEALQKQSAPLAIMIAQWVQGFVPGIGKAGAAAIEWFKERLPAIFIFLGPILESTGKFFESLASTVGRMIDYVLANGAHFQQVWRDILNFVSDKFGGLMDVLTHLDTWFKNDFPGVAKQAGDNFKAITDGFKDAPKVWKDIKTIAGELASLVSWIDGHKVIFQGIGVILEVAFAPIATAGDNVKILMGLLDKLEGKLKSATWNKGGGLMKPGGVGGAVATGIEAAIKAIQ